MNTTDTVVLDQERPGIHPAFPVQVKGFIDSEWNGLTKREYVATQLLSGLLSAGDQSSHSEFKYLAAVAIEHADTLLQQLQDAPV